MSDMAADEPVDANFEGVLLCADDYAMTNGVSQAIIELAEAGRISAVSAFTNTSHWPSHATWLARARGKVSVGLHFNLTFGSPLAPMPSLVRDGTFPPLGSLVARALLRQLNESELADEFDRQRSAFEAEIGFPPDHVDGHQHVHALPVVRNAVLQVLQQRFARSALKPLLRDPADSPFRITARGRHALKAATLGVLSAGFGGAARRLGFPCNEGFAGVTSFEATEVEADFAAARLSPARRQMVMCHPGFLDPELTRMDAIAPRRVAEFKVLSAGGFEAPLWRPRRTAMGKSIDWHREWA